MWKRSKSFEIRSLRFRNNNSRKISGPQIEHIEKIVEVPEKIVQEQIRQVPKIEYNTEKELSRIIYKEKIVEVPEREYSEVVTEKIVEVPEVREEIVVKEVPVP